MNVHDYPHTCYGAEEGTAYGPWTVLHIPKEDS